MFTWIKTRKDGKPFLLDGKYTRTSTEELLIGTRGNTKRFVRENVKSLP